MKVQLHRLFCPIILLGTLVCGCKEHELFNMEGKRDYIPGASSSAVMSGRNRVKINFIVPNSGVKTVKIYWNNRQNVKEVAVGANSTLSTLIEGLDEGEYTFELVCYDAAGKASTPYRLMGTALGAKYEATLSNRDIKDLYYDENGTAVLTWDLSGSSLETEVTYTDQSNTLRKLVRPATADSIHLVNLKPGELSATIHYKTAYLPINCIDTMYAADKPQEVITATLRQLADASNIHFGSLISYGNGTTTQGIAFDGSPNQIYTQLCKKEFNMGQAAWGPGRWSKDGPSNFNDVNTVINWSRGQYDKVMAHLITGPNNYMPDWFVNGTFAPTEMDNMLKNLVAEIMTVNDNKTKVDVWNVANELFNNDGTYRTNMRWNDMGWEDDASGLKGTDKINLKHPVFVGKAFQYCREHTNALLELRDYGIENDKPGDRYYTKYKAFYQLIKHLKATNRPVDVVGIQAHMIIGKALAVATADNIKGDVPAVGYDGLKKAIKKYKEAGVDVYFTELDIVAEMPNGQLQPWTKALAEQQYKDYYNVVKTALESGVKTISLWGLRDNNDANWRYGQGPLLFDENFNRKPAYYAVQKALFEFKKK